MYVTDHKNDMKYVINNWALLMHVGMLKFKVLHSSNVGTYTVQLNSNLTLHSIAKLAIFPMSISET